MRPFLRLLCALALLVPAAARAQEYRFEVPSATLDAEVNRDASVTLRYELAFENLPGAHAIDVVDMGLPRGGWDISRMSAQVDGHNLTDIRPSTMVDGAVEVHLGPWAIPAGGSGTFRFQAVVPDMVFSDTTSDDLASMQITPTWFGARYVVGTTDLKLAVHLPPGVDPDRVLSQDVPFQTKAIFRGRPVVAWEWPATRLTGPHRVGVSFPRAAMDRVVEITKYDLLMLWWKGAGTVRLISGAVMILLFSIFFFRFTGGTGVALWVILTGATLFVLVTLPEVHFWLQLPWVVALFLMERALRRHRSSYLPPIVTVEGGGIKRGLTAAEAAVILERPLGQVLTLVIFGLLKKGVAEQVDADPLRVRVVEPFATASPADRRKAAGEKGVVLHAWEETFIHVLAAHPSLPVKDLDFTAALEALVQHTVSRMKGFDLEQTRGYYRHVTARAWAEAKAVGELEARTRSVDRNLEWLLLDPDWSTGFGRWHHHGWIYTPLWLRAGRTTGVGGPVPSLGGGSSGTGGTPSPGFSDVAGSFAGWTENVTGGFASTLLPGAAAGAAGKGVVDLSGFDHATGDFFSALAESGRSGGGGGGGCACAGCACACACAGGGR